MNINVYGIIYNENFQKEIDNLLKDYIGLILNQYIIYEVEVKIPEHLKYICHKISDEKLYIFQNQIYIPYWNEIFPEIDKQYELCRNSKNYISKELTEEELFYLKMKYDFYEGFWNFKDDIKIKVKDF